MGAMPWEHFGPWNADPAISLRQLQAAFLAANYNLESVTQEHLTSARNALQTTKAEGDPYGLLDFYRSQVDMLEGIAIPADPPNQIDILRRINSGSGEGIGNVLDILDVSESGGPLMSRPLRTDELLAVFGTETPLSKMNPESVGPLYGMLGRGESICFPIYNDGDPSKPVGWCFVGYTID